MLRGHDNRVPPIVYAFHTLVEPAIQRFWDRLCGKGTKLANSLTKAPVVSRKNSWVGKNDVGEPGPHAPRKTARASGRRGTYTAPGPARARPGQTHGCGCRCGERW